MKLQLAENIPSIDYTDTIVLVNNEREMRILFSIIMREI